MTLEWNGEAETAKLHAAIKAGLLRAGVHYHSACRDAVSKSYPPASRPGQPPALRTGFGKSNIAWELAGTESKPRFRLGVNKNAAYMAILQVKYGRDWMLSTLNKSREQMRLLFRSEVQARTGGQQ